MYRPIHPIFSEPEIREWIKKGWRTRPLSAALAGLDPYYGHAVTNKPIKPRYRLNADLSVDFLDPTWGLERDSSVRVYRIPDIYDFRPGSYTLADDSIKIKVEEVVVLPFKVHSVRGYFRCSGIGLTSLIGSPEVVPHFFDCSCNQLTSLEGAPNTVYQDFYCQNNPKLVSLHNIHKHIKRVNGSLVIGHEVSSCLLGTLKIRGLKRLLVDDQVNPIYSEQGENLDRATTIINKHLHLERNIHLCQEELIEAGLGNYARL